MRVNEPSLNYTLSEMIVLLFLVMFVMVSSVLNFIVSVEKMRWSINNMVGMKYVDFFESRVMSEFCKRLWESGKVYRFIYKSKSCSY